MAGGDCNDLVASINPDAQDPRLSNNRLFAITTTRGDSLHGIDRTDAYATGVSYLEFDVEDLEGNPVDGALVTVFGTWAVYGHPEWWATASELITDVDGNADITVGEYNPYGYAVTSAIGDTPGGDRLYRAVDMTTPNETYVVEVAVPGTMPAKLDVTETDLTGGADAELTLGLDLSVESHRVAGDGRLFGSFSVTGEGGWLDAYLVDGANHDLFMSGERFAAQALELDVAGTTWAQDLPRDRRWVLLLINRSFTVTSMVGSVTVSAVPHAPFTWTEDLPDLHHRFRIIPGEHVAITLTP
jgi:hypothetical protein